MSLVDRALGIVLVLLVVCLFLPVLADYAAQAVPLLVSLLIFLGVVRLLLPPRQKRRP